MVALAEMKNPMQDQKTLMNLYKDLPPILIIDDEKSIVDTLRSVLEDDGFKVSTALSGDEGITLLKSEKPFLVFLDMWMPVKDGIETLRDILQVAPESQIVMISGHATITNALEAMKAGAFDFLEKPFAIKAVMATVKKGYQRYLETTAVGVQELSNPPFVQSSIEKSESFQILSKHPSLLGTFKAGSNLGQRTINRSIVLYGQCLHSGMKSGLVLEPLPLDSGIHFSHLGSNSSVPAFASNVQSTALATTLMSEQVSASTIEHLMATLSAYRISNLLVKCNGEVPIFDGSANIFCEALENVGIKEQGGDWYEFVPDKKIVYQPESLTENGPVSSETLTIEPANEFIFSYHLNYPNPVGEQNYEFRYTGPNSFKDEIAPARTFGFMKDIEHMQRMGLAAGGRLNNFILIGNDGVVNTDLRFKDELVRHKILDLIGDLSLLGRPIRAKISASMTGHADNVGILKQMINSEPQIISSANGE